VPEDGVIAACIDDAGARRLAHGDARALGYGTDAAAAVRAVDIRTEGRGSRFRVEERGARLVELTLPVPGLHNVRNALGALAAARAAGADVEAARRALAAFEGVGRRFEEVGQAGGVVLIDDYAHHPTEIESTLAAARGAFPG